MSTPRGAALERLQALEDIELLILAMEEMLGWRMELVAVRQERSDRRVYASIRMSWSPPSAMPGVL
jgi:hypothetical protein